MLLARRSPTAPRSRSTTPGCTGANGNAHSAAAQPAAPAAARRPGARDRRPLPARRQHRGGRGRGLVRRRPAAGRPDRDRRRRRHGPGPARRGAHGSAARRPACVRDPGPGSRRRADQRRRARARARRTTSSSRASSPCSTRATARSPANAGHVPPILLGGEPPDGAPRSRAVDATGAPLGAGGEEPYGERTLRIDDGQLFVLYTDGLIERRDADLEVWGCAVSWPRSTRWPLTSTPPAPPPRPGPTATTTSRCCSCARIRPGDRLPPSDLRPRPAGGVGRPLRRPRPAGRVGRGTGPAGRRRAGGERARDERRPVRRRRGAVAAVPARGRRRRRGGRREWGRTEAAPRRRRRRGRPWPPPGRCGVGRLGCAPTEPARSSGAGWRGAVPDHG